MTPEPAKLTADELAQALAHVLDTIGRIRGRDLDLYGLTRQLQPCQIDVMHLYVRAVASGLLPRWIAPPRPRRRRHDAAPRLGGAGRRAAGAVPRRSDRD